MDTISYTYAQANLDKIMEQISKDKKTVTITQRGAPSVVMMSLEDYQSIDETAYLLRSPTNARKLFKSIIELEKQS